MRHEAQIIAQVRIGRNDAFGEIIEHYQRPIIRYLLRMTGNYKVTQDLAQDTFLQAFRGILKTRSDLSLKARLYRIATDNANQYHRRRRLLSFIPFTGSESADTPNMSVFADRLVEKVALGKALRKAPQGRQVCMALHFVEGLTYGGLGNRRYIRGSGSQTGWEREPGFPKCVRHQIGRH